MDKIDRCCSYGPEEIKERQAFWNEEFEIAACKSLEEFNVKLGHEIALEIRETREKGQTLALILPVGPMGMYEWIVYYLKRWNIACDHLYCFLIWMNGLIKMEIHLTAQSRVPFNMQWSMHSIIH